METSINAVRSIKTLLQLTYGIVPIVAGADKYFDILTKWDQYLNPDIAAMLPFPPHTFMLIVGVIEIVAGIIVLAKPAIGGFIVAAWLVCIALQLILGFRFLDIAVRDIAMAIGASSMARLAMIVQTKTLF